MTPSDSKPAAIVIGLDSTTGLQTARILARRGVPVIAIASSPSHYCCRTRVCNRILFADTCTEQLIRTLERLGPEIRHRAVLFPCTDESVLLISRQRQRLAAWYHVLLPDPAVVEMLTDKARFHTYAEQQGLPVPRTLLLDRRAAAERASGDVTFPCILKPTLKTREWRKHTKAKVYKVLSPQELLAVYDRCSAWTEEMILQEWVVGTDADHYTCNCYFDGDSMPRVAFTSRKLRQWPPGVGEGCLAEECRNEVVSQQTIRLFRGVRYRGLAYLEMKRDARTGKHFIIEPNVGRPTGRSAIAEAGNVELLYTAYCDALGLPLPPNVEQRYEGAKWIYLRRDLQSAFRYWRRGDLTLRGWWRSLRGPKTDAVFSWSDPAPFCADFLRAASRALGRGRGLDDESAAEPCVSRVRRDCESRL